MSFFLGPVHSEAEFARIFPSLPIAAELDSELFSLFLSLRPILLYLIFLPKTRGIYF